ncbi:ketopantoate reductase family protein [Halorussus marinus]|uniref:ketopantoate reductase family protein n=1 Tax=Halorussus marinus TaxID=2505976 RepID=UPI00109188DC|nr:ketopantoate reductase family protein [Halorussus marinus]
MEIVVFGAGSLGSLVGGLLAREHAVTLVGRDPHVATVRESGLRVEGTYDFSVSPAATTDGTGLGADLAVVTVKAFDTEAAAEALATGAFDAALSLQNGMGNEAILADRLECPVLAGTATYGARLTGPGVVACTGEGEVVLGPRGGGTAEVADEAGRAFRAAGIETTVADDMPRRRWRKLAVNAGINATTALARTQNGGVRSGPARAVATDAARETARVARAAGIELSDADAVRALDAVAADTAENASSTLQDVLAGRHTEVEAINGHVAAHADELGVAAPVNRTLANLLGAWADANAESRP